MPAAVWRTSPARSISLWLTIWASDGLSLRTGRKLRDRRKSVDFLVRGRDAPTVRNVSRQSDRPCVLIDTGCGQKPRSCVFGHDKGRVARLASGPNEFQSSHRPGFGESKAVRETTA